MDKESNPGGSIDDLSRDTGIGKETLRVRERRYGFPQPVRECPGAALLPCGAAGEAESHLPFLDQGYHPGKVVTLPLKQLHLLSHQPEQIATTDTALLEQLLAAVNSSQPGPILQERLNQQGRAPS